MSNPDRILAACQKGNLALIQQLIQEEGISANTANGIQQSALHIASWWARSECIQYLLSQGASHSATNTVTGATPLHCVFQSTKASIDRSQRLASIQFLLQAGADPQALDFGKRTPLDYVDKDDSDREAIIALVQQFIQPIPEIFQAMAQRDWKEMKRIITDNPRALTDQTTDGHTPLLKLIIEWCDLEKENREDRDLYEFCKTAIHGILELGGSGSSHGGGEGGEWILVRIAQEKGSPETVTAMDILCQAIVDRYKMTHDGGDDDQLDDWCAVVDQLVEHSPQPPYTEVTQSLWLEVARRNWCTMALKLHDWKISYDVRNRQGMTPMQFAARSGHPEMVQLLWEIEPLVAQGQINQHDHRNSTPLQAAQVNGHDSVVALLQALSGHE